MFSASKKKRSPTLPRGQASKRPDTDKHKPAPSSQSRNRVQSPPDRLARYIFSRSFCPFFRVEIFRFRPRRAPHGEKARTDTRWGTRATGKRKKTQLKVELHGTRASNLQRRMTRPGYMLGAFSSSIGEGEEGELQKIDVGRQETVQMNSPTLSPNSKFRIPVLEWLYAHPQKTEKIYI